MNGIDFVVPWVDGSDPDWRRRKARAAHPGEETELLSDDREERYRDWDLMRFWFRGVEKFAPWVRRVWFICDQDPPAWLRAEHPALRIVRHEDFIPARYLPTFSSHPIELNLHRIGELSERFVYFNDDMFLTAPVPETFFFRNGLPVDAALLNPIPTLDLRGRPGESRVFTVPLNNAEYLNRDFSFRACVRAHPWKWLNLRYGSSLVRNLLLLIWPRFVGFEEPHLPQAFLKSTFEEAWRQDEDILHETSSHAVRNDRDVNQWLLRERQLAQGRFVPGSAKRGRVFDLDRNGQEAVETIAAQGCRMVCLNDGAVKPQDLPALREALQEAFRKILPDPCGFEREGAEEP